MIFDDEAGGAPVLIDADWLGEILGASGEVCEFLGTSDFDCWRGARNSSGIGEGDRFQEGDGWADGRSGEERAVGGLSR